MSLKSTYLLYMNEARMNKNNLLELRYKYTNYPTYISSVLSVALW